MNILKKLTSRKFILAIAGMAIGLYLAMGGEDTVVIEMVKTIGGLLTATGFGISFINAEAKIDAASAAAKGGEGK